jgi:hypothetical protein
MRYILLGGAIFNFFGGLNIIGTFFALSVSEKKNPADYAQYRLFTAGTAFTFSAMYLYLFMNPRYAMPFLIFGMCLKLWAFVVSLLSYNRYGLPAKDLIGFGVCNLVVGALFAIYLLR